MPGNRPQSPHPISSTRSIAPLHPRVTSCSSPFLTLRASVATPSPSPAVQYLFATYPPPSPVAVDPSCPVLYDSVAARSPPSYLCAPLSTLPITSLRRLDAVAFLPFSPRGPLASQPFGPIGCPGPSFHGCVQPRYYTLTPPRLATPLSLTSPFPFLRSLTAVAFLPRAALFPRSPSIPLPRAPLSWSCRARLPCT